MKIIEEFKEFAIKGNAIDLAVGVVIGAAFNSIVTSIVNDIITPIINLIGGNTDLTDLVLFAQHDEIGNVTGGIMIGNFINAIISFLIVAFTLFLIVKVINKLKRENPKTE